MKVWELLQRLVDYDPDDEVVCISEGERYMFEPVNKDYDGEERCIDAEGEIWYVDSVYSRYAHKDTVILEIS